MRKLLLLTIVAFIAMLSCTKPKQDIKSKDVDYTQFVDPFIGTAFTGHTFPGATYPLGMVQPGPETGNFSWEYCAGYVYGDSTITGFSQTRLNGTGGVDLGDLLMQPFSGEKRDNLHSKYNLISEEASPGYYAVKLTDNDVKVEITASPHVAFHKYTFNKDKSANVLADFQSGLVWNKNHVHRHVLANEVNFEDDKTITGYTQRAEWVKREYYFVIEFDKPIIGKEELPKQDPREKAPRYILTFDMQDDEELNMKIALSSTGIEGAKANMAAEVSDWDFAEVHDRAVKEWNHYLSRIHIEGTDEQKVNFYTAIYHLFIQPNNIADVDGRYVGPSREISQSSGGKHYSTLSQWDTFRAAFPMYTLLSHELVTEMVNSMLDFSEQQGHLPVWGFWGKETYAMIGNHSVPMIVDAYLKGIEGFDSKRAYNEIKKSIVTSTHPKSNWDLYDKYGYYPYDLVKLESVSRVMECGFDDYATSLMAKKMGKDEDFEFFDKRSSFYKNVYDKESKAVRPKDSNGNFMTPFDPYELAHADSEIGGHYTEGNARQYTWHVLQDIPGLIDLMGGKDEAGVILDSLFYTTKETTGTLSDVTGLIGQYAHGNEPSHHVTYIYPYLDRPKEAQKLIRQISTDFYKAQPDGLIGNDDCGQMSAWFLFSSLGFYPLDPVSGEYVIGAPQVPSASIPLANGRTFNMKAENLSVNNLYVEKIELNGEPYDKKTISHEDIMDGANLVFYMTDNDEE
ncbi:MAG TPA: GH92 family glycosyl hydrolase [Dysgonamonadaceae bacterium]|nr:GH92 family glycosyl hydrolase [Dysgonamonadaceae bacterium]